MTAARPDRAVLLVAIVIAAAIFTISFGFVADADRGTSTTATPRDPGQQPASPRAATGSERVTLGAAAGLRVRASLLAPQVRPVHRARARRVAPRPSPATSVPSTPSTEVPVPPVDASAPVAPAPSSTAPAPPPAPAPVAPKPRPKPVAKPKPPKSPDFDDSGPPTPAKRQPGSG